MLRRMLYGRRYWQRIQERRARIPPGVKAAWRMGRLPDFIDYWPGIPATLPEKMVFAELVRRQINFKFSWYIGDISITVKEERYRPDFILFNYGVIIEVVGVYWHSRDGQFNRDHLKYGLLTAIGFKVYTLTDFEIMEDVSAALDKIPEVRGARIRGKLVMIGNRPFDPVAAIRARLTRWPKVYYSRWVAQRKAKVRIRIKSAWKGRKAPLHVPSPYGPVFDAAYLDRKYWQGLTKDDGGGPPKKEPQDYIDDYWDLRKERDRK